jgi:hypothetical protein
MVDFVLVELGCAELGVAWQLAGLPTPPPALFTARERDRVASAAVPGRLRALGIIDPRGAITADLNRAITAFAYAPVEVDLRFATTPGVEVRAAVSRYEGRAFLAVVTGDHVRFSGLPAAAGLAALVSVLPQMDPARGTQISLPIAEVDAAITTAMESGAPSTGPDADDQLVRGLVARGVSRPDARLFVSLVGGRRLRSAEFGVTVRDRTGHRHRGRRTIQAVDTRRGRAVRYTRGGYLVAAPADRDTFVRILAEAADAELDRVRATGMG